MLISDLFVMQNGVAVFFFSRLTTDKCDTVLGLGNSGMWRHIAVSSVEEQVFYQAEDDSHHFARSEAVHNDLSKRLLMILWNTFSLQGMFFCLS